MRASSVSPYDGKIYLCYCIIGLSLCMTGDESRMARKSTGMPKLAVIQGLQPSQLILQYAVMIVK